MNDPTRYHMLSRLADIDVITLDSGVASGEAGQRALRLLRNRHIVASDRLPTFLVVLHQEADRPAVEQCIALARPLCREIVVVEEKSRTKTARHALAFHRQHHAPLSEHERKTRILMLGRRGGAGAPEFIKPFTGGAETTCGTWTPVIAYQQGNRQWIAGTRPKEEEQNATAIRGFLRGSYASGVCPADCSFCYLRGLQGFGMKSVLLNLEDAIPELDALPRGSVVNWAELGGPIEEDTWFVDEQGHGSLAQTILDLSAPRGVVSFFLTKGVYEPYLHLQDRLAHFAISLNAPAISSIFEPGGAPPAERLQGLRWAIDQGLLDHTIRLGPIIPVTGYKEIYAELFTMMADILGHRLKRMTVDVLRFSRKMPSILKATFPPEIVHPLLAEMESEVKAHKYRPSAARQLEIYQWVHAQLEAHRLPGIQLTGCKADPAEALQFFKAGAIRSMPCACHISYQNVAKVRRMELPVFQGSAVPTSSIQIKEAIR